MCRLVASLFSLGFEFDSEIRTWKGRGGVVLPCYPVTFCYLISKVCPRNPIQEKLWKNGPGRSQVPPFHVMTMILIQTFQRSGLQVKREKEFVIVEWNNVQKRRETFLSTSRSQEWRKKERREGVGPLLPVTFCYLISKVCPRNRFQEKLWKNGHRRSQVTLQTKSSS